MSSASQIIQQLESDGALVARPSYDQEKAALAAIPPDALISNKDIPMSHEATKHITFTFFDGSNITFSFAPNHPAKCSAWPEDSEDRFLSIACHAGEVDGVERVIMREFAATTIVHAYGWEDPPEPDPQA